MKNKDRGVAQPGRALASGARGRRFKSSHPDFAKIFKLSRAKAVVSK